MVRSRVVEAVGFTAILAWAVCFGPAAQGQDDDLPDQVVRYIGVRTGTGAGGKEAVLYVEPMKGGQRVEVLLTTSSRMVDYFQKLAPGQPVTVGLVRHEGKLYLRSISAMQVRPGEAERDTAYVKGVEVRKINRKDTTVLVLTKFKQTMLVEVPKVRTKEGLETSPALLKAIKAIKPGTLVEVDAEVPGRSTGSRKPKMPVLKFIAPWAPWRTGTFSKLGKKKVGKTTYTTIEIKSAGIPFVLLAPKIERYGRLSDDRVMLRQLRKLKRGQAVEFKLRQEGLNQFLRKIRPSTAKGGARRQA